jgi:hypothetical protein
MTKRYPGVASDAHAAGSAISGAMGVPMVMGGIPSASCRQEALQRADAVVAGAAESMLENCAGNQGVSHRSLATCTARLGRTGIRAEAIATGAALIIALLCAFPVAGIAQSPAPPLDVKGKLRFHAEQTYGPWAIAGSAAYAGILHALDTPDEWGQGAAGYGKRFASTLAGAGIHGALAFGLDSALHQDPRYYPSHSTGFWRRTGHAFRGTILTRKDQGGETLSTWRLGSAYGAAYLSNQWYPRRLNTVRLGFLQGSLTLGFDVARNLASEFRQEIRRAISRRKP